MRYPGHTFQEALTLELTCARAGPAPEGGCLLKCYALGIWLASPCLDPERWRELQREKGKDRDREERQRNTERQRWVERDRGNKADTERETQGYGHRPMVQTDRGIDRNSLGPSDSTPGEA